MQKLYWLLILAAAVYSCGSASGKHTAAGPIVAADSVKPADSGLAKTGNTSRHLGLVADTAKLADMKRYIDSMEMNMGYLFRLMGRKR